MASFEIYQDADKENPQNVLSNIGAPAGILKDRKAVGLGLSSKNAKPTQVRTNFSVLSMNANGGNGAGVRNAREGGSKLVSRSSAKLDDAQICDSVSCNIKDAKAPVAKKNGAARPTTTTVSSTARDAETTVKKNETSTVNQLRTANQGNFNIIQELEFERRQHQIVVQNNLLDDKNVLNVATPMSISEALSPMSVDRSNLSILSSADKENMPDLLEQLQEASSSENDPFKSTGSVSAEGESTGVAVPQQAQTEGRKACTNIQNDRQRFFEVVEYQDAILEYFREGEKKHRPKPNYMRRQPDINYSMRTILVDWLVEVSEEYNLDTETLYLAITYIDRFLSHMSVVRSKLQLVGTAAMYIAAKYEEIYPPDVNEFVFITDDTYSKAQVLRMEQLILKILAFDLCTPTPYVFVNTYAVMTDMTSELKFLTMYICELSLLEADPYLRFTPSIISAAAHALARYTLDYAIWSTHLEEVTTYSLESLKEVFLHLCKTHKAAATLSQQAIQEKYKTKKYNEVSTLNAVEVTAEQYDEITKSYNERIAAETANLEQQRNEATASADNVRRMISLMFNSQP